MMLTEPLFWAIATVLVVGAALVVFAPLLRVGVPGMRRAGYDMQVYRDQLREIDLDAQRGHLDPEEAAATRAEVSRRLIGAADLETRETAARAAPRRLNRVLAPAMALALTASAIGVYASLGAPHLPDQPLAERLARQAAARPSQSDAEAAVAANSLGAPPDAGAEARPEDLALIERLREVLAERPGDLEGHRLLARSLGALGRWSEAAAAQARVVEIAGSGAAPDDLVAWAELMILATDGYVSPEAEAALARALEMTPADPLGRYYSGLALLQGGRADLAYDIWTGLLAEGPPGAPWVAAIRAEIDAVARLAGRAPPTGAEAGGAVRSPEAPPPADADADADRDAMIAGMVEGLSARLATEGGPPEDWARLIRSLAVLGRPDDAAEIWAEARAVFADAPEALARINATATDAGLTR